jgi:hypothetical protein
MNYEREVMLNTYQVLTKPDFVWGGEFSFDMKVQLLGLVLTYFKDVEDYKKCAKIQLMLDKLENKNENHNEAITTGSGKL